jgi:hypothetical protein
MAMVAAAFPLLLLLDAVFGGLLSTTESLIASVFIRSVIGTDFLSGKLTGAGFRVGNLSLSVSDGAEETEAACSVTAVDRRLGGT